MSFWDGYKDEGGGKYLSAQETAALIDNAVPLQILKVADDEKNQFQGQSAPRFVVTFAVPNALTGEVEERMKGFAKNPAGSSRDRLLGALIDYLGSDGAEDVVVVMEKIGQFIALVKAEA